LATSAKYRILVERNANGDKYTPQRKGWLWGWNNIDMRRGYNNAMIHVCYGGAFQTLEEAEDIIAYCINEDNRREEVIACT